MLMNILNGMSLGDQQPPADKASAPAQPHQKPNATNLKATKMNEKTRNVELFFFFFPSQQIKLSLPETRLTLINDCGTDNMPVADLFLQQLETDVTIQEKVRSAPLISF
jgi:hypothetical protein